MHIYIYRIYGIYNDQLLPPLQQERDQQRRLPWRRLLPKACTGHEGHQAPSSCLGVTGATENNRTTGVLVGLWPAEPRNPRGGVPRLEESASIPEVARSHWLWKGTRSKQLWCVEFTGCARFAKCCQPPNIRT